MRILHVIPSVSRVHGGPSHSIAMMEGALTAAGVSVATLTTDDDGPARRLALDSRPAEANGAERIYGRKWLEVYKIAPSIVPWLWRNVRRFDVIHVHALFSFTSIAACLVARLRSVPYVIEPLGALTVYGMTRRRPWLKRLSLTLIEGPLLRGAAAVHFTSALERDEAKSLGLTFSEAVFPLGVEPEGPGDKMVLAREHPAIGCRQAVLFLSRLDQKKNVESLLHAFARLDRKNDRPLLLIAGGGSSEYVDTLRALATSLGVEEDVIWLGHVEGARKTAAFAAADVFVLPSFSENFGIAAVEAMLAGVPCILGEGVAIARDAEEADGVLMVEPTPAAIAKAIDRLLAQDALRRDMGMRGRAFGEREYSTRAMGEKLIALYEKIHATRAGCLA